MFISVLIFQQTSIIMNYWPALTQWYIHASSHERAQYTNSWATFIWQYFGWFFPKGRKVALLPKVNIGIVTKWWLFGEELYRADIILPFNLTRGFTRSSEASACGVLSDKRLYLSIICLLINNSLIMKGQKYIIVV